MPAHRPRTLQVLLVILLVVIALPLVGLNVSRWQTSSGYSTGRLTAEPTTFSPNPQPSGDWLIVVNSRTPLARSLVTYLQTHLREITPGECIVTTARTLPAATDQRNVVWVELKPRSVWTPFYGHIEDKATVIVTTGGATPGPAQLERATVPDGGVSIRMEYSNSGNGSGLISPWAMSAERAKAIGSAAIKALQDAYTEIAQKQLK
jgi:hypothetical protein